MEFQHVQCALALLRPEEEAAHRDKVTDIKQLERLILFSQVIDTEKDLNASRAIFDLRESRLAHLTQQAQSSGQDEMSVFALPFLKMREDFRNSMCTLYI